MRRGEVRWYRLSNPDKRRPVVILTRDSTLEYLAEVIDPSKLAVNRDAPVPDRGAYMAAIGPRIAAMKAIQPGAVARN